MAQISANLSPTETLLLEWEGNWLNLTIYYNGQLIGTVQDPNVLKAGQYFKLPDGQVIMVLLKDGKLELWHNETELLQGLAMAFENAYKALMGIGVFQLIIGVILYFLHNSNSSLLIGQGIVSSVFIFLSIWARFSGSRIPFWIGIVFCSLNILGTLILGKISGIFLLAVLIYFLYKGIKAKPLQIDKTKISGVDEPLDIGI